jgi:hypothetical protein
VTDKGSLHAQKYGEEKWTWCFLATLDPYSPLYLNPLISNVIYKNTPPAGCFLYEKLVSFIFVN